MDFCFLLLKKENKCLLVLAILDITSKENPVRTDIRYCTASVYQLGGEVLGEEVIYEQSQEHNDNRIIHAQHQGIFAQNNDGLAPGSA